MIEFTKGDMFAQPVDARVNTVNCVGVMGAGVALAFKKRYPDMFREYQLECLANRVVPGKLHIWRSNGNWVINFPTKRHWQDPSRYEDIASGLEALRGYLSAQGNISVALPALGCGHGGLDWSKVSIMIKEALSGLDAHIFVFEPADSRSAGRLAQEQPTTEETQRLEQLGFKSVPLSSSLSNAELPSAILLKGDQSLLNRRWIALIPSKEPNDRELEALKSIAHQMASSKQSVPIALVHATHATEQIAGMFLANQIAVILILPFGPLTRKSIASALGSEGTTPFLIASFVGPSAIWSRTTLARSMSMLKEGASIVLLSDPRPVWLHEKLMKNWAERPVFYIHYGQQPDSVRTVLEKVNAHPITRRANTREPNLVGLFSAVTNDVPHSRTTTSFEDMNLPLSSSAAAQLRSIADVIEGTADWGDAIISITFRRLPRNQHLYSKLHHILSDQTSSSDTITKSHSQRLLHEKKRSTPKKKKRSQTGLFDRNSVKDFQGGLGKKKRSSKKARSQTGLFDGS